MGVDTYTSTLIYGYLFEDLNELLACLPQVGDLIKRAFQDQGLELDSSLSDLEERYNYDPSVRCGLFLRDFLEEAFHPFNQEHGFKEPMGTSLQVLYREVYSGLEPSSHDLTIFLGACRGQVEAISDWIDQVDQDLKKIQLKIPKRPVLASAIL